MTQAVTCPGCKQQIAIDDSPQQNELNQLRQQVEELKKIPKVQSFIPGYRCAGTDCNEIHPNPNYRFRPKSKCYNCDQYSNKKEGKCAWCNKEELEEIDQDELKDKGIASPRYD